MSIPGRARIEAVATAADTYLAEFERLLPRVRERAGVYDVRGTWPARDLRELAAAGVMRWGVGTRWGGGDASGLDLNLAYEKLAAASLATALVLSQRDSAIDFIECSDNEPLKQHLLPLLAANQLWATIGISQLTTSRQGGAPALVAEPKGDGGFWIDGVIPWCTGGAEAGVLVVGAVVVDGPSLQPGDRPPPATGAAAATGAGAGAGTPAGADAATVTAAGSAAGAVTAAGAGAGTGAGAGAGAVTAAGGAKDSAAQPAEAAAAVDLPAPAGQILFVLPTNRPGVVVEPPPRLAALQATRTCAVRCERVRIGPADILCGPTPRALRGRARCVPLGQAFAPLGLSRAALDLINAHPSDAAESAGQMLCDRYDELRASVLLAYEKTDDHDLQSGPLLRSECNDLAIRTTHAAVTLYKGTSLRLDHPAQRLAREALFLLVWSSPASVTDRTLELFTQPG